MTRKPARAAGSLGARAAHAEVALAAALRKREEVDVRAVARQYEVTIFDTRRPRRDGETGGRCGKKPKNR